MAATADGFFETASLNCQTSAEVVPPTIGC
jgi:hypothetical protein